MSVPPYAATKRYAVILADPPWRYRTWKADRGMRTAESFSPTMSAGELHALRPRMDEWAARDCALFLWATPPALSEALELMSAPGEESLRPTPRLIEPVVVLPRAGDG